jgi:hypothetical protein
VTELIGNEFYEGDPVRRIKANEMSVDVHAGLNESQLMEKYGLSTTQLEAMLRKLLESDLITHMQFYERTSLSVSQLFGVHNDAGEAVRELD